VHFLNYDEINPGIFKELLEEIEDGKGHKEKGFYTN
jgi:hypothetical protein